MEICIIYNHWGQVLVNGFHFQESQVQCNQNRQHGHNLTFLGIDHQVWYGANSCIPWSWDWYSYKHQTMEASQLGAFVQYKFLAGIIIQVSWLILFVFEPLQFQ